MKKIITYSGFIFIVAIAFTGCYQDVIKPEGKSDPNGPPQQVSYKLELSPMFNTKCAVAGCHDVGSHKPYLTPDVSYYELVNGGYVNTAVPDQSILMQAIRGDMSTYIPSSSDKEEVSTHKWVINW